MWMSLVKYSTRGFLLQMKKEPIQVISSNSRTYQIANCMKLADAFKEAVKTSKHGVSEEVAYDKAPTFPHFMFKKPTRKSGSILGKMFDEAENITDTMWKEFSDPITLDPALCQDIDTELAS